MLFSRLALSCQSSTQKESELKVRTVRAQYRRACSRGSLRLPVVVHQHHALRLVVGERALLDGLAAVTRPYYIANIVTGNGPFARLVLLLFAEEIGAPVDQVEQGKHQRERYSGDNVDALRP